MKTKIVTVLMLAMTAVLAFVSLFSFAFIMCECQYAAKLGIAFYGSPSHLALVLLGFGAMGIAGGIAARISFLATAMRPYLVELH